MGLLKVLKIGKVVRFPVSGLMEFALAHTVKPRLGPIVQVTLEDRQRDVLFNLLERCLDLKVRARLAEGKTT
jgi:hypothetical protein